jgi:hypothetical protein
MAPIEGRGLAPIRQSCTPMGLKRRTGANLLDIR